MAVGQCCPITVQVCPMPAYAAPLAGRARLLWANFRRLLGSPASAESGARAAGNGRLVGILGPAASCVTSAQMSPRPRIVLLPASGRQRSPVAGPARRQHEHPSRARAPPERAPVRPAPSSRLAAHQPAWATCCSGERLARRGVRSVGQISGLSIDIGRYGLLWRSGAGQSWHVAL